MSEQVARHEALLLADEPRLQAILPQGAVVCGDKPVIVVLATDYDALHAEAEALRAENGRLKREAKNDAIAYKAVIERQNQLREERDSFQREGIRAMEQLEAARGLLRDIYMTCNLREMPSEYAIRDISNQIEALLTATQAPEVRDHIERHLTMAEQGERQEAVAHDALRKRFSEIEDEVARGKHNAMSCFTAMRTAALYIPKSMQNVLASLPRRQALSNLARDGELIASGWNACIDELNRLSLSVEQVSSLLEWAVGRWEAEVSLRPLHNVHRRSLDDTWRQVIRRIGGDDKALCGPVHDELFAAHRQAQQGGSHD